MPVLELIKARRSVRRYTAEPVAKEQLQALLEAAMAAPSDFNSQPWEFVVVTDPDSRRELATVHPWSGPCGDAPVVIAILGDEETSTHWVESTSAATLNLLLGAHALGLGAVWVGIHGAAPEYEASVQRILGLPANRRVLCLVPVGHPAETAPSRTQYSPLKVFRERYGESW